jgi:hypothetical protein
MPTLSRNVVEGDIDRAQLLDLLKEAPKSTEIKLVETRSGLRLDPSDVGVGISQVLPIVVGAVAPGGSVVAIEQPELHIHPAMQVALGDLFIEGVAKRGMSFLIETHSEHLMLRLLRRIRETTEGELPPGGVELRPDDVSVVYVQSGAKGVEMLPLPIDETGEFSTKWPKGFLRRACGGTLRMIHEYAVDPALLNNWERFRYLTEKFGVCRGRLISRFPKRWKAMVYDGLSSVGEIERKKIEIYLQRIDEKMLARASCGVG